MAESGSKVSGAEVRGSSSRALDKNGGLGLLGIEEV